MSRQSKRSCPPTFLARGPRPRVRQLYNVCGLIPRYSQTSAGLANRSLPGSLMRAIVWPNPTNHLSKLWATCLEGW